MSQAISATAATAMLATAWHLRPPPLRLSRLGAAASRPRRGGDVRRRARVRLAAAASAIAIVGLTAGPFGAAVAISLAILWPRLRALHGRRAQLARADAAYPELVDLLVAAVNAGCTPVAAMQLAAAAADPTVRDAVGHVLTRSRRGDRFADAVGALVEVLGPPAQSLADALALSDRYGTPLPPVLERLASEATAHRRRQAEADARRLPVRLTFPLVGCVLPSFVLLTVVPLLAGTLSSFRELSP